MKKAFVLFMLLLLALPAIGLFSPTALTSDTPDAFINNNIAFQDELITFRAALFAKVFRQSGSDQVIMGQNGFLYFEQTLEDYYRHTPLPLEAIADTLAATQEALNAKDIGFTFILAPDKWMLYPENMPYYLRPADNRNDYRSLMALLLARGVRAVDALSVLEEAKLAQALVYHPSDTHWTAQGALAVYRALMASYAVPYNDYQTLRFEAVPFQGDLARLYAPLIPYDTALEPMLERLYHTKGVMRSPADPLIRTTSPTNTLKLLVFRDSFGEALFPYLANNTGSLTYSRLFPVDDALVAKEAPDEVVLILAQRNLLSLLGE